MIEWADELGEKIDEAETKKLVKLAANYLLSDFSGILKEKLLPIKETLITPENFAELVCLVYENKVSSRAAKDILREMFKKGEDPSHILERTGVAQVSDAGEIEVWAQEVIDANEKAAADFKGGNEKTLQFLVGQLMARSRGKANPKLAADVLKKLLS
jgi:aspartyl-tRNA(Asn)/glutamyl-tRNA(Gln) amidotransferase subunit B